jgi:7-cyano-7-deazaguanine synthase in queuosine biosynthesis
MSILRIHCEGHDWLKLSQDETAQANYHFDIASSLIPEVSRSAARDLLRIGQAAFLADRAFRRGKHLGQRTRRLRVIVPVEDPKCCTGAVAQINQLATFVSNDEWEFEFVKLHQAKSRAVRYDLAPNTCISLFSGGLDSLCGAAAALKRGDCPIFVTHSPPANERVSGAVSRLTKELGLSVPSHQVVGFHFQASDRARDGRRRLFPERSRRTRPMFYLCLAGAVALECGVSRIYLNENGVLAINLPLNFNFHGSQISRHAHPETLRRFKSLLLKFWDGKEAPSVINPFINQTKGEQLSILGPASSLAAETISCEYAGHQIARMIGWLKENNHSYQNVRECGLCLPCLVRRIAMNFAGLADGRHHYAFDVSRALRTPGRYKDHPLFSFLETSPRDLLGFTQRIQRTTPSEFVLGYAIHLSLLNEPDKTSNRATFELYQRFAEQTNSLLMKE